jgi:hypothetical protein
VALAVMAPTLLAYLGDHVAVLAGGRRCTPGRGTARAADTHVLVTVTWTCPSEGDDLRYRVTLFQDVDPAARHVALVASGGSERETALDRDAPEIVLSEAGSSVLQVARRFVQAGIEHILLGYDHIAFLLAVILWGRHLWPLIKVVTAFTVAHSLTLSLAVLDIVRLPSSVVAADRRNDRVRRGREFLCPRYQQTLARDLRAGPGARLRVCGSAARVRVAQ